MRHPGPGSDSRASGWGAGNYYESSAGRSRESSGERYHGSSNGRYLDRPGARYHDPPGGRSSGGLYQYRSNDKRQEQGSQRMENRYLYPSAHDQHHSYGAARSPPEESPYDHTFRQHAPPNFPNSYRHHPTDSDIPSLVESDSSLLENSWSDDEQWNRKMPPHMDDLERKLPARTFSRGRESPERQVSYSERIRQKEMEYSGGPKVRHGTRRMEIAPGVLVRLRGADETWNAVCQDFFLPSECRCCSQTIFCIQDADFILCPECKVVSPVDGKAYNGSDGGVGLGFSAKDLAQWQDEIAGRRGASNY